MGDREGFMGPGHRKSRTLQAGKAVIVPAITAGGVGIQHHPHLHPPAVGPQQGVHHLLGLELELLEQKLLPGGVDQLDHHGGSVLGHHQQPLVGMEGGDHREDLVSGLFLGQPTPRQPPAWAGAASPGPAQHGRFPRWGDGVEIPTPQAGGPNLHRPRRTP